MIDSEIAEEEQHLLATQFLGLGFDNGNFIMTKQQHLHNKLFNLYSLMTNV